MTPTPTPANQFSPQSFRLGRPNRNTRPPVQPPTITPFQPRQAHGSFHIPSRTPVTPLADETSEVRGRRIRDSETLNEDEEHSDDEEQGGDEDQDGDGEADDDIDDEGDDEDGDDEDGIEAVNLEAETPFDPVALGLKEIGNLASWTVSSCKPGCGVEALRNDDTLLFWQSDGPQPHHLNIHFSRLVSILHIRLYLDFLADESYTPTRLTFLAGTGYHDLIPFSELDLTKPHGWTDVSLENVGGGRDKDTNILRCFLLQVKVVENHQNGKDTHIRGLKVYARDERLGRAGSGLEMDVEEEDEEENGAEVGREKAFTVGHGKGIGGERTWLVEPEWMGEAELR